jgi:glycosyltransferase involved in cell wall biosynthesis
MLKPIVLILLRYYLPGNKSGGPVRSVANIIENLGDEIDFYIITSDRDYHDKTSYPEINVNKWNDVGKAKVFYTSINKYKIGFIFKIINEVDFDALYLNSFYDFTFSIKPIIAHRLGLISKKIIIVAPRGEFSDGAYAIKKLKKYIYLWVNSKIDFYCDVIWQASSKFEKKNINEKVGVDLDNIIIAPNFTSLFYIEESTKEYNRECSSPLRIVFLSRICKKKNLDFALKVLLKVTVPIEFYIYGPIEDLKYWETCQLLINVMPAHIKIHIMGIIEHSIVVDMMKMYDLFFFPTHGENFGHVIAEAMAASTPILISDETPWRDLDKNGVGWDLSLSNPSKFAEVIELVSLMDIATYLELRNSVSEYFTALNKSEDVLIANRELFFRALSN